MKAKTKAKIKRFENKITAGQFSVMAFLMVVGAKLFIVPLLFLSKGGRGALLPLLVFFAIDLVILATVIVCVILSPQKNIFELLEQRLGKILTKIVLVLPILTMLLKILFISNGIIGFVSGELINGMPRSIIFLALIVVLVALGSGNLRSLGRLGEIIIIPSIVGVIALAAVLLSGGIDFINILPLKTDAFNLLLRFGLLFGDTAVLLFCIGKVKKNAKMSLLVSDTNSDKMWGKALVMAGLGVVIVVGFFIFSTANITDIVTVLPQNSIAAVTKAAASRFSIGRFDKLLWMLVFTIAVYILGVFFYTSTKSIAYIANIKSRFLVSLIFGAVVFVLLMVVPPFRVNNFIMNYGIYFAILFSIGFVATVLVAAIRARKEG